MGMNAEKESVMSGNKIGVQADSVMGDIYTAILTSLVMERVRERFGLLAGNEEEKIGMVMAGDSGREVEALAQHAAEHVSPKIIAAAVLVGREAAEMGSAEWQERGVDVVMGMFGLVEVRVS